MRWRTDALVTLPIESLLAWWTRPGNPAGWTSACEALASGTPVVLYEGLTARELRKLGAADELVRTVPTGNYQAFSRYCLADGARAFAAERLNMETTGATFATFGDQLEKVLVA
jgi:hypothetical protein